MADFTLTVTISGNVVGKSISFTHSDTISDITEFGEDHAELDTGATVSIFSHDGTKYRGRSEYIGPELIIVQNETQNAILYTDIGDGSENATLDTVYGWPHIFYHSDSYDASFMYDAATPGSPDKDIEVVNVGSKDGALKVNAVALFKAIS